MPQLAPNRETAVGRRRGRVGHVTASLAEINVIPLVDIMLVMLIIFMVTAPMMQRGVDVALPVARQTQPISAERLFVTVPLSFREAQIVHLNDEPVRLEVLAERIRQALLDRSVKEVFLRGDGGITYQELMTVMDRLKEAGVEKVGLVARLPGER
jgi:biopolymer transport protein TolR